VLKKKTSLLIIARDIVIYQQIFIANFYQQNEAPFMLFFLHFFESKNHLLEKEDLFEKINGREAELVFA